MQPRPRRLGNDSANPLLLGVDDGSQVLLVETTGLAFGLHKGQQRWVTGDQVLAGVEAGLLSVIDGDWNHKEVDGEQVVQGPKAHKEPASSPEPEPSPSETAAGAGDEADGYALVEAAHGAYEADAVADMSIPKTKAWIGDDMARAEAVEAQESAGQKRKGLLEHVEAMFAALEVTGEG